MLDNTIITKFELSEREKRLKRQFFKREEQSGKRYLFSHPPEKNDNSINNQSNYTNNSESLVLDKNQNSKLSNQFNINISYNDKNMNNSINKNVKEPQNLSNQKLSNSIPEFKNITQEDMNKFYEEAANFLPKYNGGIPPEQINLLLHQNKIMQRNVDALQETNRSLQDFIIYTIKKDSNKNNLSKEMNGQDKNNIEYEKLNRLLTPLYNHINNLQSEVKELNQKRKEDEINVELDNLIIKNQKTFNPQNLPQKQSKKNLFENDKNNKIMMKTLSSLKGTMSNMTEEMKKIGNAFNEKMQKVLEDTEKNKLKSIVGGRVNAIHNKKAGLGPKSIHNGQSNNISIFKDNGNEQNESFLKNKLDNIDYESFKSDLIDIGHIKDAIVSEYNSGIPEFPKLTKPKTKIKFSYNLDKELNNIMNKVNNRSQSKPNLNKKTISPKSKIRERVSSHINNGKPKKYSKDISSNKKPHENNNKNYINDNKHNINNINNNDEEKVSMNKNNGLNEMSVVDKMNLYKEKMAQLSGNYEVKENNKKNVENNPENLNPFTQNNANDLGSNHSGVTYQVFNKPSSQKKNNYNPPKVKYGVFHGQKGIPNYNPNINQNEEPKKIIIPEIVLPEPEKLNNVIKNKIDDYLLAAFNNLKPTEAPKINLNNENNKKDNIQNTVQRVIEKEYITKNIKEVQNVPQPIVINPPQQNMEQNHELIDKFINLTEKITNLEEKISKQIIEQKNITEKKINIIEQKEKPERKPQPPEKKVILPDIDIISKLVIDKIKNKMNIDINLGRQQNQEPQISKKIINEPKEEEKKEEEIDIFDINQKTKIEDLDDIIRMPRKLNLDEYEVSQTSSYLSQSLQKNNFNMNSNNQITINKKNIRIENNVNEMDINQDNDNDENSKSKGEISNDDNSSSGEEVNKNIKNNKTGIDLLNLKNINEQFQNQINYLQENNNYNTEQEIEKINQYNNMVNTQNRIEASNNNIINIPKITTNNYNDYINYLNNNNNVPIQNLNPFDNNNINMEGASNDNFFNDSGENN